MDCHADYYNTDYNKSLKNKLIHKIISFRTRKNNQFVEKFWGTTPWRMDFLRDVYKVDNHKIDLLIMGGDETYIVGKKTKNIRKYIREKYGIPQDAFLVITGGRLDKRKQQHILMDAVKDMNKDKVWLLAFGTPTDEMKEKYAEYAMVENIVMPGWISGSGSYDLFLASDLAVFPGTHSVLWEQAVACGIPGIFKYWKGMTHVKLNENAILLKEVNVETIKNAIQSSITRYEIMKTDADKIARLFYLDELAKKSITK
jgi:glycosyltransferase involved in cell wall biosynthesis